MLNELEVVILAGGFGTRLKGVVSGPKVMAPVNGRPFIEYILNYLSGFNVSKVILSLGYKHEEILQWAAPKKFPFDVDHVIEQTPLGTGGAIKLALSRTTKKNTVILNGDTFFRIDLNRLADFQNKSGFEMSIALKAMKDFDRYGNVTVSENSEVLSFEEKRHCADGNISGGIYAINNPGIFENYPDSFSIEQDYLHPAAKRGKIGACKFDGYFIDIGIPSDYQKAQEDFKQMRLA